ncbi:imidazole glycerol phosphate synthase subunit HisH [Longitalea arenae]|uniref:imidazole glycerol phosphate synthase subunit HisH n=1 Tax=Longitalea arenae TaxID=2812558 RepID=UPI001967D8E8|nr:imidazole glycerol phosphate synthase subunit HisH [Longitalea arenae]
MDLVIIKYNAGNIQSVLYALERIGVNALVTDDYEKIQSARKVIFPGVGEASSAMRYLKEHKLDAVIKDLQQPVLGICLGMQLMCAYSEENDTACLGIFDETVRQFMPPATGEGSGLKVPQIGWNNIFNLRSPLFSHLPENSYCYFVHGYYAALGEHTIATADYVQPYSAALHKDNFYGAQFHPEKSAKVGEQILKNFLSL